MNAKESLIEKCEDLNTRGFAVWAEVYDKQDNPLLRLEERYLDRMLPGPDGRSIIDVGCGTGRWLERINRRGRPKCISGLDASSQMLDVAKRKGLANTTFIHAQLPSIPAASASVDLMLASFVLSYVDDIDSCACEISRVVQEDGDVFISDMHPTTALKLGWKRAFSLTNGEYVLTTHLRPIEVILRLMDMYGFELVASYEPRFGESERIIFESHSMHKEWQAVQKIPPIYLLHFKKKAMPLSHSDGGRLLIEGANIVIGDNETVSADILIHQKKVEKSLSCGLQKAHIHMANIDLEGYVLFPGLINAHDHLEFALFPRLGAPPYRNATEWALDIQERYAATIALHKQVPKATRLWWGGLRNLLCGVTTVCHHNPIDPVLRDATFPIKVVTNFGWEHSPEFAKDIASAWKQTGNDAPFVIHACEGTDYAATDDFQILTRANVIDYRTVLVHGLALTAEDIQCLNQHGASLVTCMSSNHFLFERTVSWQQIQRVERLAIGSDSPLTAGGDLLDEIRFCKDTIDVPASVIYGAVTDAAVRILRLKQGEGRIGPGSPADLFAVRTSSLSPAAHLASLHWQDVELVMVDGTIRLASEEIVKRLPDNVIQGLNPIVIDGVKRWLAAPVQQMFQATADILGSHNVSLCERAISVVEA